MQNQGPPEESTTSQFDLTEGDSDRSNVQEDRENLTESDTESCGVVGRPVRRFPLMWRTSTSFRCQWTATTNDLARVRQQFRLDGVRVRGAGSKLSVREFGPTPGCSCAAPAIRRQRWFPAMVSLLWSAAGADQKTPMVEFFGDDGINDTSASAVPP